VYQVGSLTLLLLPRLYWYSHIVSRGATLNDTLSSWFSVHYYDKDVAVAGLDLKASLVCRVTLSSAVFSMCKHDCTLKNSE
jgi:hypothetical protein